MADQRLRPWERLKRPSEFQPVFRDGEKLVAPAFVLYVLPGSGPTSRLGMAVSRRVGSAVVRNRVKRLIREVFRLHKAQLPVPCDVVFVARPQVAGVSLGECTRQYVALLRRRWPDAGAGQSNGTTGSAELSALPAGLKTHVIPSLASTPRLPGGSW